MGLTVDKVVSIEWQLSGDRCFEEAPVPGLALSMGSKVASEGEITKDAAASRAQAG